MKAQVFDVISREKLFPFGIPAVEDFELSEKGFVNPQTVLDNPNILLYCLEPQNKQAVFVETPDIGDIIRLRSITLVSLNMLPQVLKISYETQEQLAGQVILDDQRMILIYSMGRCGTTLTSSAFNLAEGVVSLSEPDVFAQLVQNRCYPRACQSLTMSMVPITCEFTGIQAAKSDQFLRCRIPNKARIGFMRRTKNS